MVKIQAFLLSNPRLKSWAAKHTRFLFLTVLTVLRIIQVEKHYNCQRQNNEHMVVYI